MLEAPARSETPFFCVGGSSFTKLLSEKWRCQPYFLGRFEKVFSKVKLWLFDVVVIPKFS